ncbi:MAG: alginate export family protein [Candidatus Omnitrophica bacterium]|nr:alginate export family protein [Candidatus Omnitrophota bacterium]
MGKRLILVLALALLVGLTFSAAYAEVQNVKVSGDIIASGVAREHFNLQSGAAGDKKNIDQSFFMTQTRVRIDADLTDNVMATVRLINERVWNGQNDSSSSGNIDLDLAYVTLKEFLYSPLTLTIGRQEIRFGNGLIIGNAKVPATGIVNIPTDLTERKAFDAIRATLDYDPLVVDIIYAKINEQDTTRNNDTDLAGVNATYALNKNTNVSAYYFLKSDNNNGTSASKGKADKVNTIGALVSSSPIENLLLSLEGAYQFGKVDGATAPASNYNSRSAYAIQAMADYTFAKVKMTPKVGASYTYLSGDKSGTASGQSSWDSMYYDQKLGNIAYALLAFTDLSVYNLRASCKPVEDVTLSMLYGYFDMAKKKDGSWNYTSAFTYDGTNRYFSNANLRAGKGHLGDEIDVTATYDYTEDVQFGLTGGIFLPGKAWDVEKQNATQLIGSMKVTF